MSIAALTLTPDTIAIAFGAYELPMPADTADSWPAVGATVRILAGPYRGQFGRVVRIDEGEWSPFTVDPDQGDKRVYLAPNELLPL